MAALKVWWTSAPPWVKVFAVIGIVLLVLVLIVAAFGGGPDGHGPRRHALGQAAVDDADPPLDRLRQPPAGPDGYASRFS